MLKSVKSKLNHIPKIIAALLILLSAAREGRAQNFGLKIIQVADSSSITQDLQRFDSLWYECMHGYGKSDVSNLFADHLQGISKTNPITLLNFISGIDMPFSDVFGFKLIHQQAYGDSVNMYQLDMGWMQLAALYHRQEKKLMRFESLNIFKLIPNTYQILTVYTSTQIPKKELAKAYNQVIASMKELGSDIDSFKSKPLIIYSGATLKDAYGYVGGLEYVNFFNPGALHGGMGDPFNRVILSGIPKPVHVHEVLHFAITFPCNQFIGEGLASYYGGIGATPYDENKDVVLKMLKNKGASTFSSAMMLWRTEPQFNSLRANYVMAAMILERVKSDFNLDTYRNFVRHCRTDEEMVNSLKALYQLQSEEEVFLNFFLK